MTRALARARDARGYSLVEMVTVLLIFTVVMTGLTTLFIAGSTAELDANKRFQAQQEARIALDKLRREVHCAKAAGTSPTGGSETMVTLDLSSVCPAAGGVDTSVSWCTQSAGASHWTLYRTVGTTCDATGVPWARYLTQAAAFDYQTQAPERRSRLRVELRVDVDAGGGTPAYTLCDVITLRNSTRTTPNSTIRGYTDTADPASC